VIVNDGSKDNTIDIVREKQAVYADKTLVLLSHLINRG
jgi:glycosyltransferase involved in cell wall biosynthesis